MAHPKRKISKTRRDKRRTHLKLTPKTFFACPNCGNTVAYHCACTECGYYKGRQIIEAKNTVVVDEEEGEE